MPLTPQPSFNDSRLISHSGNEPLVATDSSRPFRSATLLIGASTATVTEKFRGAPAIAPMPRIGEPLTANTMLVPPASPISVLLEIKACCSLASPLIVARSRLPS